MIRSKTVITNRNDALPSESDARLSRLIREEMDRMVMDKEQLDVAFPEHVRTVSERELWRMARNNVLEQLCDPDSVKGSGSDDPV